MNSGLGAVISKIDRNNGVAEALHLILMIHECIERQHLHVMYDTGKGCSHARQRTADESPY